MSERRLLGINLVIDDEEQSLSIEQAKELYNALGEIFGGYSEYEQDDDCYGCGDCFGCGDIYLDGVKISDIPPQPTTTLATWSASFDENTGIYTFSTGFSNAGKG